MRKNGLLAKVANIRAKKRRLWSQKLPKPLLKELIELRDAYLAGSLKNAVGGEPSLSALYDLVTSEYGKQCSRTTFCSWMRDVNEPGEKG